MEKLKVRAHGDAHTATQDFKHLVDINPNENVRQCL